MCHMVDFFIVFDVIIVAHVRLEELMVMDY